jgi:hypothetical protein
MLTTISSIKFATNRTRVPQKTDSLAFGARKRVDGLKRFVKSGAVAYRTRKVNCAELSVDF